MIEIPPVDLLLAGCGTLMVFVFALAALSFDAWRRATRRQSQHLLTHSQSLLEQLTALDARVNATATAVRRLDERLERARTATTTPLASAPAGSGYQIAIRLARSGATRDELISSCGLSFGEAELVRRLHGVAQHVGGAA
jgi:replicative DNA helicase